jgi:hypothetical protein
LARRDVSLGEILVTNITFMLTTWVMERIWMRRHLARRTIVYDRIDLIHPDKHHLIKEDLKERTGLEIKSFKIGQIDLSKNNIRLTIFYRDDPNVNILTDAELSDKEMD